MPTDGGINGRAWRNLSPVAKAMYVAGFEDALTVAGSYDKLAIPGFTYGEISHQLDLFYHETANVRIQISAAFYVARLQLLGQETDEEIRTLVVRLRASAKQ
jgi:hypothetical protein